MEVKLSNALAAELELVVKVCSPIVDRLRKQIVDVCSCLSICHFDSPSIRVYSSLQVCYDLLSISETCKVFLTETHHFHKQNEFVSIFLNCHESLNHKFLKLAEGLRLNSSQYLNIVPFELERSLFKLDPFTRSNAKNKSKIYVHNVSFCVYKNISIVSVFDLQDICSQAVGSQTSRKLFLSLFVKFSSSAPVIQHKVVSECLLPFGKLLFDSINTHSVINHFY